MAIQRWKEKSNYYGVSLGLEEAEDGQLCYYADHRSYMDFALHSQREGIVAEIDKLAQKNWAGGNIIVHQIKKMVFAYGEGKEKKCKCGKPGKPRVDNSLTCGVHCDTCWDDLVRDCRKRSW
jgi:hypothetical protein